MSERDITLGDVQQVIERYTFRTSSKNGKATVAYGVPREDGRTMKVVLLGDPPREDPYIVMTVAWRDE